MCVVYKSEDNLDGALVLLTPTGQTQVIRLGGRHFYPEPFCCPSIFIRFLFCLEEGLSVLPRLISED